MEHWIHTQLGNLVEVKSGIGFPKELQGKAKGSYPVYKVGDISKAFLMNNAFVDKAENYVSNEEVKILKGSIFREGSTVFAKIGEAVKLNRRGYISQPGLADNNVMAVIPLDNSLDRFIYFFLNTVDLSEAARSTTVPSIRKGDIENLIIPLPPLAEQHYLADKLDSLLTRIQTLSDQLAAVPALLKQFRQSVLADAVSGKLTAGWREENQEAFPQMVTIAEVADFSIKKQKLDDDLPVSFSSMHYMSEKTGAALGFEEKKWGEVKKGFTYFENNDVLLAKITPCFENGKTAVARNLINGIGTGSTEFMVMRPNEGLLPDYLLFNINTNNFRRDGATNMTGSVGHKRVPKDFVENWPILLPSLAEQTEIVRRVEALFALADQIEQQSRAAAERVALLTQSVLAKAFRGELSAQWRCEHPDLISGDNSAAALLARIQAEREATGKKSRRA